MKGVLVTGATTPVGIALIRRLVADDRIGCVLALGVERHFATPEGGAVIYRRVDLTRERHMRRLLFGEVKELGLEAIVHLALHRGAGSRGQRARLLNVEATRRLLSLAERHPTIRRFVYRSYGEVFDVSAHRPDVIGEDHPLDLSPSAPQWVRDRVEADLTVCTRMGLSPLSIIVLRAAECLARGTGSQLYDYLQSKVCFRPLGYDPMLNLISLDDLAEALALAVHSDAEGVFTIPGRDTLPLSEVVRKWGRVGIPVPGPLLGPLYAARRATIGTDFRWDLNQFRFHFSGVLDGHRANLELGYEPRHPLVWHGG